MPDSPVVTIENHSHAVVAHVQVERLEEDQFWAMRSEVLMAGAKAPKMPVVLDMAPVKFMPSLSLGGLIRLAQEFRARPQRLVCANLQPEIRQMLDITRVGTLFEVVEDLPAFLRDPGRK